MNEFIVVRAWSLITTGNACIHAAVAICFLHALYYMLRNIAKYADNNSTTVEHLDMQVKDILGPVILVLNCP